MAKKSKKAFVASDYLHVSNNPSWVDSIQTCASINDDFHRIMDFYVTFCICPEYATQGRTLSFYKWKEKPWKTYSYLKRKLDYKDNVAICKTRKAVPWKELKSNFSEVSDSQMAWYESLEEFAFFTNVETSEFMSLFYHIRCALAHGRFAIMTRGNNRYYVMENGVPRGNLFYVKARCCIKETTLLHWIEVISAGPRESEKNNQLLVLKEIIKNPSITQKTISSITNLTDYEVRSCVSELKEQVELRYTRKSVGKSGYWEWNELLFNKVTGKSIHELMEEESA